MNQPKEPAKAVSDEQEYAYTLKAEILRLRDLISEYQLHLSSKVKEIEELKEQLNTSERLLKEAKDMFITLEYYDEVYLHIQSFLSRTTDKEGGEG